MRDLIEYLDSKERFQHYIKQKVEGRCHVNNKGWNKLYEFHLSNYLEELKNPFGFLYNVKNFHKNVYRSTPCMVRYYHKYRRRRELHWDIINFSFKDKDGHVAEFSVSSDELTKVGK